MAIKGRGVRGSGSVDSGDNRDNRTNGKLPDDNAKPKEEDLDKGGRRMQYIDDDIYEDDEEDEVIEITSSKPKNQARQRKPKVKKARGYYKSGKAYTFAKRHPFLTLSIAAAFLGTGGLVAEHYIAEHFGDVDGAKLQAAIVKVCNDLGLDAKYFGISNNNYAQWGYRYRVNNILNDKGVSEAAYNKAFANSINQELVGKYQGIVLEAYEAGCTAADSLMAQQADKKTKDAKKVEEITVEKAEEYVKNLEDKGLVEFEDDTQRKMAVLGIQKGWNERVQGIAPSPLELKAGREAAGDIGVLDGEKAAINDRLAGNEMPSDAGLDYQIDSNLSFMNKNGFFGTDKTKDYLEGFGSEYSSDYKAAYAEMYKTFDSASIDFSTGEEDLKKLSDSLAGVYGQGYPITGIYGVQREKDVDENGVISYYYNVILKGQGNDIVVVSLGSLKGDWAGFYNAFGDGAKIADYLLKTANEIGIKPFQVAEYKLLSDVVSDEAQRSVLEETLDGFTPDSKESEFYVRKTATIQGEVKETCLHALSVEKDENGNLVSCTQILPAFSITTAKDMNGKFANLELDSLCAQLAHKEGAKVDPSLLVSGSYGGGEKEDISSGEFLTTNEDLNEEALKDAEASTQKPAAPTPETTKPEGTLKPGEINPDDLLGAIGESAGK